MSGLRHVGIGWRLTIETLHPHHAKCRTYALRIRGARAGLPRSQHAVAIAARAQVIDSGNASSLNCALLWFSRNGSGISRGCGVADPVRRRWMDIHRETAAGFGITGPIALELQLQSGNGTAIMHIFSLIASDVCRLRLSKNTDSKLPLKMKCQCQAGGR